jgi:1-deoxy-D-xylulose-5-phosphate synthase
VGKLLEACLHAADELAADGVSATVWDVRVVSPPDPDMLADAARHALVVTAEDGVRHGGAGAFIVDAMTTILESRGQRGPITRVLGIPREYIAQGKADDILEGLGLNGAGIAESVRRARQSIPAGQPQA